MSKGARVAVVVLALLAFAGGFLGVAGALYLTQPAVHGSTQVVPFEVKKGDTANAVGQRLQDAGLIRNALVFRLLAKYRHLDTQLEPGVYQLSPAMTMDAIIQKLLHGQPDEQLITIPPGHRVAEYPDYFSALQNFDAKNFLKVAQTGVLKDGTKLSSMYWYLPSKQANTVDALEGYLFPNTYYFNSSDDEQQVIEKLLINLGEQLCPGPADQPDQYISDQAQCKAHGAKVGKTGNIFTEMEQHFNTTNDVLALYDTLTLSSIVVREVKYVQDIPGIADVYYNRYSIMANGTYLTPGNDTIVGFEADPTVQYARDTDSGPDAKTGQYWDKLADGGRNVDPNGIYNTYTHKGLMPGPIAAPRWEDIVGIATANEPTASPNFWFVNDCHGTTYYASTYAQFQTIVGKACQG
ncbi:MAG TPA: endolytic transglycosylase MltG [Ktedonobacterales bacterium]|jgi:UPF0755 protein